MNRVSTTRVMLFAAILFTAMLFTGAGCNTSAPVQNAQVAAELDVLKEGLEAWKSGSTAAALESTTQPIQFNDRDWSTGAKLLEYQVVKLAAEEEGETVVAVKLKLTIRGKVVERQVNYRVAVTPQRTVARYPPGG